jgi:hypothetical protein
MTVFDIFSVFFIYSPFNAVLICLTTTAFSRRKPQILYEEPTVRTPKLFANEEGHDLATCYSLLISFLD